MSVPTFMPTVVPSVGATTLFPLAAIKSPITEKISNDELEGYTNEIAEFYGLYPEHVNAEVTYSTTGTMTLDFIPEDLSEEELTEAVKQSLAETLHTHPQNVEVQIDMETGEVIFTVTSDDITVVQQAQFDMQNDIILDEITESIEKLVPGVTIQDVKIFSQLKNLLENIQKKFGRLILNKNTSQKILGWERVPPKS